VSRTRDRRAADRCEVNEEQSRRTVGGAYIQSPNLKFAFGFGGLLDSTNVLDSWCIGATRSGSGENVEGGGKEMIGEFISRENGGCGEKEESGCEWADIRYNEQCSAGECIRTGRRST
jgi:hypothetical protein